MATSQEVTRISVLALAVSIGLLAMSSSVFEKSKVAGLAIFMVGLGLAGVALFKFAQLAKATRI